MKKLVMLFVAVLAASVVNAASAKWTMTKVGTVADTAVLADGYSAYLFIVGGDVTYAGVQESLANGDMSVVSSAKDNAAIASGKVNRTFDAGLQNSQTYQAFAVIFDAASAAQASNYIVTSPLSATVAATGATVTYGFGSQAEATWTSTGGGDVPEPTSGLLLLVGGAMLALRRKQK